MQKPEATRGFRLDGDVTMPSGGTTRIGLLGGTFDPPHIGHVLCAARAAAGAKLDEVVFVVAGDPYQKETSASPEDRLAMVDLVVDERPGLSVSALEIDREGPSYTIDTVRTFQSDQPDADFWFVAGSDTLTGISTWHEWRELLPRVGWVVIPRPSRGAELAVDALGAEARVVVASGTTMVDMSSTEVRARVAEGLPIGHLVQSSVAQYIAEKGLYRD